ncbi:O-antigen ligase family protein [Tenacibaculum amylolyticum]|uniref:O-antigen ligase family protein n=1 Tax=Tenacibaculum amylolyticum TaxID=104269 RepID=UPI0038942C0B
MDKIKKYLAAITAEKALSFLLFLVVGIIPLVIHTYLRKRDVHSLDFKAYPIPRGEFDFFHYYKGILLVIITFFILAVLLNKGKRTKYKLHVFLLILSFFILLSSIFSEFRAYTLIGGADSYQGVLVWLSYMIICFGASQLTSLKYVKIVVYGVIFSAVFLSVIGVLEYFSIDFHKNYLAFFLETNGNLNYINEVSINSISYNTNYYAMLLYVSLIIISVMYLSIVNRKIKTVLLLSYLIVFFNLTGTRTLAGDIIFTLMSLLLLIIFWKKNKNVIKDYLILLGSSFIIFLFVYNSVGAANSVEDDYARFKMSIANSSLEEIKVKRDVLEIKPFKLNPLFVKVLDDKNIKFSNTPDFNGQLQIMKKGDTIMMKDEGFEHYKLLFKKRKKYNVMILRYNNEFNYEVLIMDKTFKTINPYTKKIVDIITPEKTSFLNKQNGIISGRGIVWSLGIPLLKDRFFLGSGADTFPLTFPNHDYVSKLKVYGKKGQVPYIAASHSLYLQIGVEFGVIAMFTFIIMIIWYLISSFKLLLKVPLNNWIHYLSLGCFLAVLGFSIMGVISSGMLSAIPTFWVLLGLGLAVNGYIKKNELKVGPEDLKQ